MVPAKRIFVLCALFILCIVSCKKDDDNNGDDRPNYYWSETTCTINGKLWGDCYPSIFLPGAKSSRTSAGFTRDGFLISSANFCKDDLRNGVFKIYIVLKDDIQEGSFTLDSFHYGGIELAGGDYYYDTVETSLFHTGELKVDKFDEERISGRFEFKAYHKQRDSVYSITNGKFTDVSVSGSN